MLRLPRKARKAGPVGLERRPVAWQRRYALRPEFSSCQDTLGTLAGELIIPVADGSDPFSRVFALRRILGGVGEHGLVQTLKHRLGIEICIVSKKRKDQQTQKEP